MAGLNLADKWNWVTSKLLPKGRVFAKPPGGVFDLTFQAINQNFEQTQSDAYSILLSAIPDNSTFSYQDAIDWYRRFGIYNGFTDSSHLAAMKAAILQRMSWPLSPLNMQSPAFIQQQLQTAGFPVYIYPNRFTIVNGISGVAAGSTGGLIRYRVGDILTVNTGTTLAQIAVSSVFPGGGTGLTLTIGSVNSSGGITAYTVVADGTLYQANQLVKVNGSSGSDYAILNITAVSGGVPTGTTLLYAGSGYTAGSTVLSTDATAFGDVTGVTQLSPGAGYSVASGVATTAVTGYGSGAQVNITAVTGTIIMTLTPGQVLGTGTAAADLAAFDLGAQNLGGFWNGEIIANSLEPATDAEFGFTSDLSSTFYISGGSTIGAIATYASIPAVRQTEFRQLVLQLKRCETVGFVFVNYT